MCAMLSLTPLALVSSHFDLSIACPDHAPYPPDLDQKVHDIRRSASAHQQHPIIAHSASGIGEGCCHRGEDTCLEAEEDTVDS